MKIMGSLPPGRGYVLDPDLVSDEELRQNLENVETIATRFLEIVCSSVPRLPS